MKIAIASLGIMQHSFENWGSCAPELKENKKNILQADAADFCMLNCFEKDIVDKSSNML